MIDPGLLANGFESNTWVILKQVEGLTHEDSLIQPPFRGNCLNWVLGHIADNRNTMLRFAGELARTVGPQGRLCLSGIQGEDSADVLPAFAAHGGLPAGQWKREDWLALEIHF